MTRNFPEIFAFAVVASLAAACSAAPDPEGVAAMTSQALNDPNACATGAVPFTSTSYQKVWTPPDPGSGINKGYWSYDTICTPLTGTAVVPPGGYPAPWTGITPDQCSGGVYPVPPPADLTGCTAGLSVGYVSIVLCPMSKTIAPPYEALPPDDPCVGPLLDSDWQFVQMWQYIPPPSGGTYHGAPIFGSPGGGCGACVHF